MKFSNEKDIKAQMRYLEAENERLTKAYQKEKDTAEMLHEVAWQLIVKSSELESLADGRSPKKLNSKMKTFLLKLILKLIK